MTAPSPLPRSVRSARRAVTVATVLVVAAVGVAFAVGVVQAVTGDATRTAGGNFVALVLAVLAVGVVVNALFDATDRLRELEPAEGPTDARDGAA